MPENMDISLIFNVVYLYEFHEYETSDELGTLDGWKKQLLVKSIDQMEEIMATRVGKKTHRKEYLKYLVKWRDKGPRDTSRVA